MSAKKKLLLLGVNFLLVFALYQVLLVFEVVAAPFLYMGATVALVLAYYIVNRGFSRPPKPEEMPKALSAAEKCARTEDAARRFGQAQKILLWLLPFLLTLLFDMLYLFLLEPLFAAMEVYL